MPKDVGTGQHAFYDEKVVTIAARLVSVFHAACSTSSHEKTDPHQACIGA
jgi:hypothetical protein